MSLIAYCDFTRVDPNTLGSEVFVADHGCNLFALDLRNGKVSYGYKGTLHDAPCGLHYVY